MKTDFFVESFAGEFEDIHKRFLKAIAEKIKETGELPTVNFQTFLFFVNKSDITIRSWLSRHPEHQGWPRGDSKFA